MSDGTAISWQEVFDGFKPALTSYARSRGIRDPDDLVQDVFLAAVERHQDFEGDRTGLRSLLFTIAYRRIADHHRRSYRRPETLVADQQPAPDAGLSVEEVVNLNETASEAMVAFAALSLRERRVLQLRIFEEATPAEVGKALGLSTGNVRVIQARALSKVREYLKSWSGVNVTPTLAVAGIHLDFVRRLFTPLPTDGALGAWIREVRSAAGVGDDPEFWRRGRDVTALVPPHDDRVTESVSSLISTIAGPGAAKIGAILSVVALSASTASPPLSGPVDEWTPEDVTSHSTVVEESDPSRIAPEIHGSAADPVGRADDLLSVKVDMSNETTGPGDIPGSPGAAEPIQGDVRPIGTATSTFEDSTSPQIDDVVAPIVEDTLDLVVDDVVVPLTEGTLELVVEDVAQPLLDDVATPLVEDVVQPLAEDTVETVIEKVTPLTEDVVTPRVDDVGSTLDETIDVFGGLLGS